MLNYIALYPTMYEKDFNQQFIVGEPDKSIVDYIIMCMREVEKVENIKIEEITVHDKPEECDYNYHTININFKKKDLSQIEIPKHKYVAKSAFGEVIFKIRITTNLSEKVIEKRILYPLKIGDGNGYYLINNKKMRAIWQMVDASTYTQRGKITQKSRMPIIIYYSKNRVVEDVNGDQIMMPYYSYALDAKAKKRWGPSGAPKLSKKRTKFYNPLIIYAAKMGIKNTIEFFGMKGIVNLVESYKEKDLEDNYIFKVDNLFVMVDKYLFDKYEMVRYFTCMCCYLKSKDFPLDYSLLEDKEYWICRVGYVGSTKNKNIHSFKEKGITTIFMIERLLDNITIDNLRLPEIYKHNIYYFIYWMITNFHILKKRSNLDMANKRVRKNEYLVGASLGKKLNENLNKLVERKSKSKMNTMETLLEIFNFNSDIIISSMRNLNDLVKPDDLVNDMNFILDLAYSAKGPSSLGEASDKMIATKYRYLHPSMVGKLDISVSSNSDVGMSGSIVPFVKTYNGFYFTPDVEPCDARFNFDKALLEEDGRSDLVTLDVTDLDSYIDAISRDDKFRKLLEYEPIEIIEKEV